MTTRKSAGMKKLETEIYFNPIQYLEKFLKTYPFGKIVLPFLPWEYEEALDKDLEELKKRGRYYVRRSRLKELSYFEGEQDYIPFSTKERLRIEEELDEKAEERFYSQFRWMHDEGDDEECPFFDETFFIYGNDLEGYKEFYNAHLKSPENHNCSHLEGFNLTTFDRWRDKKIDVMEMAEFGYSHSQDKVLNSPSYPIPTYCAVPFENIEPLTRDENAGYIAFNPETLTFIESENDQNTDPIYPWLEISKLPPLQMSLKPKVRPQAL